MLDFVEGIGWPITIVFAALCLGFVCFLFKLRIVFASSRWPVVSGKIVRSELTSSVTKGTGVDVVRMYDIDLSYEYLINRVLYSSNKICFFSLRSNNQKIYRDLVNEYRIKKSVDVYYNPKNFKQSVLEPGISGGVIFMLVFFGITLVSIGLVIYKKSGY